MGNPRLWEKLPTVMVKQLGALQFSDAQWTWQKKRHPFFGCLTLQGNPSQQKLKKVGTTGQLGVGLISTPHPPAARRAHGGGHNADLPEVRGLRGAALQAPRPASSSAQARGRFGGTFLGRCSWPNDANRCEVRNFYMVNHAKPNLNGVFCTTSERNSLCICCICRGPPLPSNSRQRASL